ncbi:MAG TPA: Hsp20/alpha crystallin family protein [Chthoniobacteraceae bacterium]|nr:Hsp20/alpha crystallin family protein [Chthoniobacteraceae bacterium]
MTKPEQQTQQQRPAGNGRANFLTPVANIHEDKDGYTLEAEMPGVTKDGLDVTVENGELVIVGRRSAAQPVGQALYRESRGWDFRRAFELDPSIDAAKITAKIEQGVLTLHLPKAEAVKPRKIAVS